jgi:hypothetical protein
MRHKLTLLAVFVAGLVVGAALWSSLGPALVEGKGTWPAQGWESKFVPLHAAKVPALPLTAAVANDDPNSLLAAYPTLGDLDKSLAPMNEGGWDYAGFYTAASDGKTSSTVLLVKRPKR